MPHYRLLLSILVLMSATTGQAQAVRKKQLLMSVGGGFGIMNVFSDRDDITVEGLGAGALRAAFGYAVGKRISLGIHYDRVGSTWHNGGLDRLHMTTYLLSLVYRPWISERSAWELEVAFGTSAASLFPLESRLPYTTTGGAVNASVRYFSMWTNTLGLFIAADHASSNSTELVLEGGLVNPGGDRSRLQWNSPRVTAGLLVRF